MAEIMKLNIPTPPGVTNVTAEKPEGYFIPEHIPTTIDDVRVGDIFHCHWGATNALNDYYKVVKRTPKMVTLRLLRSKQIGTGFLSGIEYPIDEFADYESCYVGGRTVYPDGHVYCEYIKRLPSSLDKRGRIWVKLSNDQWACQWDGHMDHYDHCD